MSKMKEAVIRQKVKKLLNSKTPEEYIDLSVKSNLPQRDKAMATKVWLGKTKYSIDDIAYARNRHPYWKAVKQKNHQIRTKKRFSEYDYSGGKNKPWTPEVLKKFLDSNEKKTDRELAQEFKRSIPSIQAIRRRINLANRVFKLEGASRVNKNMMLKKIQCDEKVLRKKIDDLRSSK